MTIDSAKPNKPDKHEHKHSDSSTTKKSCAKELTLKDRPIHGWLCVHKPVGPSSFDIVRSLKPLFPRKTKIGHGGTLDPKASGVLPIAIGEATKTVDYLMHEKKEYVFTVAWGAQTLTDDAEDLIQQDQMEKKENNRILHTSKRRPTPKEIESCLKHFLGHIKQVPPLYSAKKVSGKRACDRMRSGETVTLDACDVKIFSLASENHTYTPDNCMPGKYTADNNSVDKIHCETSTFRVTCSKGTYVRSLARDMGIKLGCYGHATAIHRTRVGGMTLDKSLKVSCENSGSCDHPGQRINLANVKENGVLSSLIQPIQTVLADIPAVLVTPDQEISLRQGQVVVVETDICFIKRSGLSTEGENCKDPQMVLCISHDEPKRAVAIAEAQDISTCKERYIVKPKRVFNIF